MPGVPGTTPALTAGAPLARSPPVASIRRRIRRPVSGGIITLPRLRGLSLRLARGPPMATPSVGPRSHSGCQRKFCRPGRAGTHAIRQRAPIRRSQFSNQTTPMGRGLGQLDATLPPEQRPRGGGGGRHERFGDENFPPRRSD
jgi:hypothetical protein